MDIQPQALQQPISDDQELAKVLAGINQEDETPVPATPAPETPAPETPAPAVFNPPAETAGTDLEAIKKEAIYELRPLVDKLDLSPEEKFDTYLLLLRSTDDATLIPPAHDTAKLITDETRRAQALLDIIKEIDYLANPQ